MGVDKVASHSLEMSIRMGFGEEISKVDGAWAPLYDEFSKTDPVTDPVKTHVKGTRASGGDGIVGQAGSALVVTDDEGGSLWIAEVGENVADIDSVLTDSEETAIFGFRGRGDD